MSQNDLTRRASTAGCLLVASGVWRLNGRGVGARGAPYGRAQQKIVQLT